LFSFIEYARSMTLRDGEERLSWDQLLLSAYAEATGVDLPLPLTDSARAELREWLQRLMGQDTPIETSFIVRGPTLDKGFFLTMADKVSFLTQAACWRCPPDNISPHWSVIPIGVPPISSQSSDSEKRALFKARVTSALSGAFKPEASTFGNRSLCVVVATMLAKGVKKKDADNLCKALLDDMQGIVYDNDSAIQHLQSYRFQYGGTFSGHMVRVAGVRPDMSADVLDPRNDPTFLSGIPGF